MTSLITGRVCQHNRSCDYRTGVRHCRGKKSLDSSFPERPTGQRNYLEFMGRKMYNKILPLGFLACCIEYCANSKDCETVPGI